MFRVVALPAPSDREKTQMFMQRYIQHFPAAGEVIIFDRSWYNRAGVEYVMGFCTEQQYRHFLKLCPEIESYIVDGGIMLIKFWLEVGQEEQERRFAARIDDPLRQWKLSPMDLGILRPLVSILEGARLDARRRRTARTRPGTSFARTTSGVRVSTASRIFSRRSSPAGYRGRKSSCPSDPRRENTTTKRACAVSDSLPSDTNVLQPMRRQQLGLACYFM